MTDATKKCPFCGETIPVVEVKCKFCQSLLQDSPPAKFDGQPVPEATLMDVAANLFRGAEGVGGRLKITTHRLLFEPHAINIQKEPAEILLGNITEVGKRNTLGIVPNGMFVRTKGGEEFKFVVWGRENLINMIQAAAKDRVEDKI